ncbi:MAG: DUF2461 domain-containing protein [Bauldia sp.]|uniref:DUF2461 domain-containing protein n=1 Tax=Bauldia sp. TaxID=2575872 RepID=UPI001DBA9252|nr:DUF2461 domain-containing protein [Bauldia sp.]MCB1496488.1 DUF2461 domain-containing protein [Bauldia sp.]
MDTGLLTPRLDEGLPRFLDELSRNNNKNWFDAHRDRYQQVYVAPALALIAAMAEPLAALDPPLTANPKVNGSLRRINRDVRFSRDKRPYSAMLHLIFYTGERANHGPGVHVVVGPGRFGIGAGHWAFEPAQLEAYRAAVTTRAGARGLLAALDKAGTIGCRPDAPQLARLPRGYDATEPVATMLRRKGVVVRSKDQPIPDALFGAKAPAFLLARIKALMPLIAWLEANVFG